MAMYSERYLADPDCRAFEAAQQAMADRYQAAVADCGATGMHHLHADNCPIDRVMGELRRHSMLLDELESKLAARGIALHTTYSDEHGYYVDLIATRVTT